MYDVIIIGAGPAGLTAALYLLRANKKVLVLESKTYGGKIINASKVENYPGIETISGFDYATNLYNQVKKYNLDIKYEMVTKVTEDKKVYTNNGEYTSKAVIIATGSDNKKLCIDNEEKFIGNGVSYCATCDGNFFKNKTAAVIGGGETAIDDALYLSEIVNNLYVINKNDEFNIESDKINLLEDKSNIKVVYNADVKKINGENKVESITVDTDGIENTISVDGIFVAIGMKPNNKIFSNVVDIDEKGYIKTTDGVHTKTKGIYVAGDARVKELRQLTTAVSDGSVAATIAIKELNN